MPVTTFLNFYNSKNEQSLLESLCNEAINLFGFNGYYIPRFGDIDLIYGEDVLKTFPEAYMMAMRLENQIDPGMNQDFFTKFGLEIRNNMKIHLSRREFESEININQYSRPREGDLIFIPHLSGVGELYEIKFVNDTVDNRQGILAQLIVVDDLIPAQGGALRSRPGFLHHFQELVRDDSLADHCWMDSVKTEDPTINNASLGAHIVELRVDRREKPLQFFGVLIRRHPTIALPRHIR